jgi:hypothetical protein
MKDYEVEIRVALPRGMFRIEKIIVPAMTHEHAKILGGAQWYARGGTVLSTRVL